MFPRSPHPTPPLPLCGLTSGQKNREQLAWAAPLGPHTALGTVLARNSGPPTSIHPFKSPTASPQRPPASPLRVLGLPGSPTGAEAKKAIHGTCPRGHSSGVRWNYRSLSPGSLWTRRWQRGWDGGGCCVCRGPAPTPRDSSGRPARINSLPLKPCPSVHLFHFLYSRRDHPAHGFAHQLGSIQAAEMKTK